MRGKQPYIRRRKEAEPLTDRERAELIAEFHARGGVVEKVKPGIAYGAAPYIIDPATHGERLEGLLATRPAYKGPGA